MTNDVHHPVVARMWDRMSRKAEGRGQGEHRGELLRGLAGRVIEGRRRQRHQLCALSVVG
jgi:hypothetical protein